MKHFNKTSRFTSKSKDIGIGIPQDISEANANIQFYLEQAKGENIKKKFVSNA